MIRRAAQSIMTSLKVDTLNTWKSSIKSDSQSALAATVLRNVDAETVLVNRDQKIYGQINLFNNAIEKEGAPVTNQKASGRCWLFATTNVMRIPIMKKYNLEKFTLSPSFLFFYDKLEKSNYFLDQIIKTADEEVDSRLIQHLLTDPICDGGQYGMVVNILEKYGLVPDSAFPDTCNTLASRRMNFMITTSLRQYAQELREAIAQKKSATEVEEMRETMMKDVHRMLCLFLGTPPGPNDKFTWEWVDKDKKYGSLETTPLEFYKEIVEEDSSTTVSLLNDPRNDYNRIIKIDRLGNVVGAPDVSYLNVDIDTLAKYAVERIKNNKGVFFGAHTPIYMDKKLGIMDLDLWDYKLVGFNPEQQKADRLRYHQSLMTHAMVFTAVHLDSEGKPLRWRVENSWGEDVGQKGYWTMTHDYFKEYIYQIVVEKNEIPDLVQYLDDKSPIVLPPWDPCGALARE